MKTGVVWKAVPGFESRYLVSSDGQIKSLNYSMTGKAKLLKPWFCSGNGYFMVTLHLNGRQKKTTVHSIVCLAFHGPANGLFCDHINSNKLDNRAQNLRYLTNRDNVIRAAIGAHTGFVGVRKHGREKTFRYDAKIFGVNYSKSGFNTALEASKAREQFISEAMTKQMETV